MTIVAAWMSADTGVGPAIASPSQRLQRELRRLAAGAEQEQQAERGDRALAGARRRPALTVAKSTAPKVTNMSMIAMDRPKSPTRLTTNALLAAVAYAGLWFQKPMSRYDARPTPSQPT